MKMKRIILAGLCCIGLASWGQETPQLDALRAAERNPAPALPAYAPNFVKQAAARRNRLDWLRAQVDTLDIPESKRYRIMRDLYRGREALWLEKYHLSAQPPADSLPGKYAGNFHNNF